MWRNCSIFPGRKCCLSCFGTGKWLIGKLSSRVPYSTSREGYLAFAWGLSWSNSYGLPGLLFCISVASRDAQGPNYRCFMNRKRNCYFISGIMPAPWANTVRRSHDDGIGTTHTGGYGSAMSGTEEPDRGRRRFCGAGPRTLVLRVRAARR
jgi:hypothetical protein